jgi:colanic acid/amylovoran biosynthesis glycosyltransferase
MPNTFAEITTLPVVAHADGTFTLTRKFADGMRAYVDRWNGPVMAVMHPQESVTDNLDNIRIAQNELGFRVQAVPFGSNALRELVRRAGFVHWGPHHLAGDLGEVLSLSRVPNVYSTEYALKTRMQIVNANVSNPVRRLRKYVWELGEERRMRRSVSLADGFEANGTPTYDAFGSYSRRKLLYFATWMRGKDFIEDAELEARLDHLTQVGRPLRLVFSGRLIPMKGVLDLISFADALHQRRVAFTLTICGGGPLAEEMQHRVEALGLQEQVIMKGVLDFSSELVPFVKKEADLFVCCHRQGDPSSTYLETAACGVPILGTANEAFAGLAARAKIGWTVPLGDVEAMAKQVEALAHDRDAIARRSRSALHFARDHTFEKTFARRIEFFEDIAKTRPLAA